MSKFRKNSSKYFQIYSNNVGGLFHTSRNPVFPKLGHAENVTDLDYLQILRPASLPVSDAHTLAGNPRIPGRPEQGIKPEIYKKWNQKPKICANKEWSRLSMFY